LINNASALQTASSGQIFYLGRYSYNEMKAVRLLLTSSFGTANAYVTLCWYDVTTDDPNKAGYYDTKPSGQAVKTYTKLIRDGNHNVANIAATQTITNKTLQTNGTAYHGAYYTIDFSQRQVTVDQDGFQTYYNDATATATLSYDLNSTTYTSKWEGDKPSNLDTKVEWFISCNGQYGRLTIAEPVVYTTDASTTTLPVTTISSGSVSSTVSAMPINTIASSYLNTDGTKVDAASCGDLSLSSMSLDETNSATTATASYKLTVTAAKSATLVLPFEAAVPTGVKAYTLTYTSGNTATGTSVSTIPANTPVYIEAEDGDYTFTATSATINPGTATSGALTGVYAASTVPTDSYVLQNQNSSVAFYKVSSGTNININPYRAYLTAQSGGGANSISLNLGDVVTGISELKATSSDAPLYNVSGMRVQNASKGLYIQNGKLIIK
jgi:hypothetical protein